MTRYISILAMSAVLTATGAAAQDKLTISVYSFAQDAYKEALYDPFEEICGCELVIETGNSVERMAKIEANHAGADDAVMLDQRGFLAETNATNVFVITDGVVETSRAVACPEGITRETVLGLGRNNDIPWRERDISMTHVYNADEVFTTGTMGELAWVGTVDGRSIGGGSIGPVTQRLRSLFTELTKTEGVRVVD